MALTRLLQLAAALLLLSACTTQSTSPTPTDAGGFAAWTDTSPDYRLGPGDRLRVEFLLTPEMGEDAVVGPDGYIGLRVAGRVQAGGLTAEQLQAAIAKAASKNLKEPVVTVSLIDPGAARIVVGGQVQRPGIYALVGRDGPLDAVMLAGGFLPESRMDEVVLIRRNAGGKPMLRTVDLQRFVNTADPAITVPLQPGDIVFVPRTRVAEVALWVDQVLNRTLPFSKSLNYNINPNPSNF